MTKILKYLIPSFTLLFIFSFLNCTGEECLTATQFLETSRIIAETLCEECQDQKKTLIGICDTCHRKIIEKLLCKECQNLSIKQILSLIEQNKETTIRNPLNVINKGEQILVEIIKHIHQCSSCQEKFNPSFISYFINHPAIRTTTVISSLLIIFIKLFPV